MGACLDESATPIAKLCLDCDKTAEHLEASPDLLEAAGAVLPDVAEPLKPSQNAPYSIVRIADGLRQR
jgi:hypothetical protein